MPPDLLAPPLATVPPPADLRQMIGIRAAELRLLRRLLGVSESRARMLPTDLVAEASNRGLPLTTADKLPAHTQPKGVARG